MKSAVCVIAAELEFCCTEEQTATVAGYLHELALVCEEAAADPTGFAAASIPGGTQPEPVRGHRNQSNPMTTSTWRERRNDRFARTFM
jgi:hypothetical protein